MTAQEQQLLQGLTERISKAPLDEKDPEAEQYLQQTLGRNPDALYILAQTVLVQQYALDNAQKQLADLRTQLDEAQQAAQRAVQQQVPQPKHTSFLGNLLGLKEDDPAPPPPPQTQYAPVQTGGPRPGSFAANQQYGAPPPPYGQPRYGQPQYAPPQQYATQYGQSQYAPPQYGAPQYAAPAQSGSFLRTAAMTAAGVAAGAVAFEGIESLVHGFEHNGGRSMGDFSGGSQAPREEVINNYYGDSSPAEHHSDHLSSDIEDRRNDTRQFAGSGSNDAPVTEDDDNNDFSGGNGATQDDDNNDFADTSSQDDGSGNDDNNDFSSDDNNS